MIRLALRMGKVMMPRSAWSAFRLQTAFRLLGVVPPARNYFAEMKYKPKPRFDAGFLAGGKGGGAALTGRLFPQPEVRFAGRAALLDEFLGDHFALVSLPQTPVSLFDSLPPDLWRSLNLRRVAIRAPGDSPPPPNGVFSVMDIASDFTRTMQHLPPGLALIRPDRYVAAYLPAGNIEEGMRGIDEIVGCTWK
jgi:3-(3-hydroxy-phenyl)propionate hydroxylase